MAVISTARTFSFRVFLSYVHNENNRKKSSVRDNLPIENLRSERTHFTNVRQPKTSSPAACTILKISGALSRAFSQPNAAACATASGCSPALSLYL
jgi:hypothetical protein